MASEELIGMEVEEAATLDAGWMLELLGIPVSATRRKCALLSLKVVRHALTGDGSWPTDRGSVHAPDPDRYTRLYGNHRPRIPATESDHRERARASSSPCAASRAR